MPIINPGDYSIDPTVVDGTELAAILNRTYDAIRSGHLNASRPPYVAAGGVWTQDAGNGDMNLMFYDGANDHKIGQVVGGAASFGGAALQQSYTAGTTYKTGDIVMTGGKIYRALQDIASSPATIDTTADFEEITDYSKMIQDTTLGRVHGFKNLLINGEVTRINQRGFNGTSWVDGRIWL